MAPNIDHPLREEGSYTGDGGVPFDRRRSMLEFGTEADSCRGLAKGIAGVVGRAIDTSAGTIELPGIVD